MKLRGIRDLRECASTKGSRMAFSKLRRLQLGTAMALVLLSTVAVQAAPENELPAKSTTAQSRSVPKPLQTPTDVFSIAWKSILRAEFSRDTIVRKAAVR